MATVWVVLLIEAAGLLAIASAGVAWVRRGTQSNPEQSSAGTVNQLVENLTDAPAEQPA